MMKKQHGPAFRKQIKPLRECYDCRGNGLRLGMFHELECNTCNASGWVTKASLGAVTLERDTADARVTSLTNTLRLQRELTEDINRVSDDAKAKTEHVTAAVAIADGRARSLQQQITDLLDRGEHCSAEVASGSKARAGLTVLLAELRRSADETAGRLAEALDRSRIAGFACEATYSAAKKGGYGPRHRPGQPRADPRGGFGSIHGPDL